MEQAEMNQQSANAVAHGLPAPGAGSAVAPQQRTGTSEGSCPTCGSSGAPGTVMSFVYALGKIEPRFPRLSVEKEFAQVAGRTETAGLADRQVLRSVLSKPENRYLARQLCWVMMIEGTETYILLPRDSYALDLLVEALRPTPSVMDLDAVIGLKGPVAPPEMCNGLQVPIVAFDQIYSFDREALLKAIPRPADKSGAKEFATAAGELFDRIMQMTDNAGSTDEHRALNYLAVRYPAIYAKTAEAFVQSASLTAVEVRPSTLTGARKIVEVIFSYTNRTTDVTEKFFCRVDVTEEFPFLVTKLSPYFDR